MTLPETVADMPVTDWAIEAFLRNSGPDWRLDNRQTNEDAIREAIMSNRDAVAVARSRAGGGIGAANGPTALWDEDGIHLWPDHTRSMEPVRTIPWEQVVEYVRSQMDVQMTMF